MPRSVSSREVRLHVQDELRCIVCPVKCREVTVKKKRVETFRNTVNGGNLGRTFVLRLYPSEEYCKMSESMVVG